VRLITLNVWGGRLEAPLLDFVKANSTDVDVFCFQEVFDRIEGIPSKLRKDAKLTLLDDLKGVLKGFDFRTAKSGICENQGEILTVFVKNGIEIRKSGVVPVCVRPEFELGLQYLELVAGKKIYTVFNIHGYWDESGKGETPERFEQSENILKFMKGGKGKKILCGDFNMRPNNGSTILLEKDLRNLVKEHKIGSTRTKLYNGDERFADYIFVSKDVKVSRFEALGDVISDHMPLLVEFS
jgi:endonuclease/exonuclease/phosphatase family metal-dependent hydrolase